jgi:AraC-like DNA-binding protein
MRKYSYLTKMILFGCILCTLPVIFFGVFSYYQSSKEIQKQVNRGQMQLLTQMNSNVEQTLRTVSHGFNQLVNSTVVARVFDEPFTPEDFMLYRDLRREISNTQSFYTRVEDIVLVNLNQNWLVKNSGFYRMDDYIHRVQISNQQLLPNTTSWVLNPSLWFYSEEKANSATCPYTISLVKKLPDKSLQKYGLAYANIPTCSFSDLINRTPEESETIIIFDDQERILFHSDPSMIGKYVIDTGFIRDPSQLSQASGQFQAKLDGDAYTASYLRSSFNQWVYVSVISIESLTKESKKIGQYTILVCLIIVLVFMTIALFGSRQMYTPIQRLLKQIGGKGVATSGRERVNEFDFISDQVQDLFQSKSQLEQEVHRHFQQSRTFFLMKMFQGTMRRSDLTEKLGQFGYLDKVNEWKLLSVITLQIDTLEETRYFKEDQELLLFAINNMVEELIPAEVRLPPVFIDQTQVTLIGRKDQLKEFNDFIYSTTETIQRAVQQVLGLRISLGISLPFEDIKGSVVAYREGLEALKHRIHLGEGVIIPYANLNAGKPQLHLDYPALTESELVDAIRLADENKSRELLHHFMQIVLKHEMTPQEYQVPMVRLLSKLLVTTQESGIPLTQLQKGGESLYEELYSLQIASEIEEWFWSRLIVPLIGIFRDRQNSQYHNISEKIIDMVHKYYDTDLTIEKCADALHYNANYLSGVFRKETNMTFSEYLTAYRFTIAKKWLSETDMTIKEMAEKLGYINSQNFIRSFRKLENVTPGQYREQNRQSS